MIKRSSFLKGHARAQAEVGRTFRAFLRVQGPEEVHRLRTAVRRFDRSSALLPASMRREKKRRRSRSAMKDLARLTNRTRDIDVIRSILMTSLSESELTAILGRLKRERLESLGPALRAASAIESDVPEVDWEKVRARKLRKRYRKVTRELLAEIEKHHVIVVSDASDAEALHALRILSKELRYTLELCPKSETGAAVQRLEEVQDLLGRIRDIDATTEYVSGLDPARGLNEFVRQKREERHRLYLRFVDASKQSRLVDRLREMVSS